MEIIRVQSAYDSSFCFYWVGVGAGRAAGGTVGEVWMWRCEWVRAQLLLSIGGWRKHFRQNIYPFLIFFLFIKLFFPLIEVRMN